jgi:hypothetical protein
MAVKNPALVQAFQNRNCDRAAVDAELRKVETALAAMKRNPYLAQQVGEEGVRQLFVRGHQLGAMLNAKEMISRARRDVIRKGKAVPGPIDDFATETRAAVAAAVRGAGGKVQTEPMPKLGGLSQAEYRNYVKSNYGFDPDLR